MATINVTTGVVVAFAGDKEPAGWKFCRGQTVSKNDPQYAALFGVIGTIYGGDANPGFRLPDYRGYFLRGVDAGAGRDPDVGNRTPAGGVPAGDQEGSTQQDAFLSHAHGIHGDHIEASGGGGCDGTALGSNSSHSGPWQHDVGTAASGGSETRPKNVYVNYLIAL